MIETWRMIAIVVILLLGVADLILTYHYVKTYRGWQETKPFNMIELNPLLVFLWNNLGLIVGMLVGSVMILTLQFLVARNAHWGFVILLGVILCWVMYNHSNNISLLNQLIEKYPSGHLPVETFGNVIGSNPK